jgi:hypothetical protein
MARISFFPRQIRGYDVFKLILSTYSVKYQVALFFLLLSWIRVKDERK